MFVATEGLAVREEISLEAIGSLQRRPLAAKIILRGILIHDFLVVVCLHLYLSRHHRVTHEKSSWPPLWRSIAGKIISSEGATPT